MSIQTQLDEAFEAVAEEIKTRVRSLSGPVDIWVGTRAEYDEIATKDDSVLYVIKKTPTP